MKLLLLPELLTTFPKFRFLYYITVERLLKTERLELIEKLDNCPHPFDQWLLQKFRPFLWTLRVKIII